MSSGDGLADTVADIDADAVADADAVNVGADELTVAGDVVLLNAKADTEAEADAVRDADAVDDCEPVCEPLAEAAAVSEPELVGNGLALLVCELLGLRPVLEDADVL